MDKRDESEELEGLRVEDGSQPVNKGVKIVEYSRMDPSTILYMDMGLACVDLTKDRETYPKKKQIIRDKKSEKATVNKKTTKGTAVSTVADKKGGRKK